MFLPIYSLHLWEKILKCFTNKYSSKKEGLRIFNKLTHTLLVLISFQEQGHIFYNIKYQPINLKATIYLSDWLHIDVCNVGVFFVYS